jgi:DNA repair protein RadD
MPVTEWKWRQHISRTSGKQMLMVTYYGALSDKPVNEYLTVMHDGYAGQKARTLLANLVMMSKADLDVMKNQTLDDVARDLNQARPPMAIKFKKDGKFFRVTRRDWDENRA